MVVMVRLNVVFVMMDCGCSSTGSGGDARGRVGTCMVVRSAWWSWVVVASPAVVEGSVSKLRWWVTVGVVVVDTSWGRRKVDDIYDSGGGWY